MKRYIEYIAPNYNKLRALKRYTTYMYGICSEQHSSVPFLHVYNDVKTFKNEIVDTMHYFGEQDDFKESDIPDDRNDAFYSSLLQNTFKFDNRFKDFII